MTQQSPKSPLSVKRLCDVANGSFVQIDHIEGNQYECERLREMGFCEKSQIQKISQCGAYLCRVCGSRVAIGQELAEKIFVEEQSSFVE